MLHIANIDFIVNAITVSVVVGKDVFEDSIFGVLRLVDYVLECSFDFSEAAFAFELADLEGCGGAECVGVGVE